MAHTTRHHTKRLFAQAGIYRPLLELRERLRQPALQTELAAVYESDAPSWGAIANGAPTGTPSKPLWLVGALPMRTSIHYEMLIGLIGRMVGYSPIVVQTETAFAPIQRRYHQLIGHHTFLDMLTAEAKLPPQTPPPTFTAIRDASTMDSLMALTYRDVPVGRIALTNVADRHKFERITLENPSFREELYQDLLKIQRWVHVAEVMLNDNPPDCIFFVERSFSPSVELSYVAGLRGIPVIQIMGSTQGGEYRFKRFLSYAEQTQSPQAFSHNTWEHIKQHMAWNERRSQDMITGLDNKYLTGQWGSYVFHQSDRKILSADEMRDKFGITPNRKIAVVFSHVLWDQPYQSGTVLHHDYETWLIRVIELAIANDKLDWVIKLHPDLNWSLKNYGKTADNTDLRELRALRAVTDQLPPHVHLVLPTDPVSTYSYFSITDYALTVQGTIGLEMAARGIPVITGGGGRYSGYGFTFDPETREAYDKLLLSLPNTDIDMTAKQIELAQRFTYVTFWRRGWRYTSLSDEKRERDQINFAIDWGLRPTVNSYEAFAQADDIQQLRDWLASNDGEYLTTVTDTTP